MPTLTKKTLVESLNEGLGLNKREARDVVEHLFEEVKASLANGEPVKLSGLGNFNLRGKCARPGRNPKTGKDALISPRRVVTFRAGPKLKVQVSQYSGQEIVEDS